MKPKTSSTALIGIGSNVGDRREHLDLARRELEHLPHTAGVTFSPIYETEPVGPIVQGPFLNAAAALSTTLEPLDLLAHLRRIERLAGLRTGPRWGPRFLDLDLLLYDDRVIETEALTLPHPRMHGRRFVLEPLCDIAPNAVHPVIGRTVRELLDAIY